jgi:RNA polymerase sigma-70 factor (ECF subfamily)
MTPTATPEQDLATAYAMLRRGLLATIRYRVRDAQVTEDLLHDVFVKAAKAVSEGRAPGNLAAWLHQVVRTTVIDHYRARKPEAEPLDEETAHAPEVEDLERFQTLATCLRPLVASLPALYRDALMAADFQGLPLAHLAEGVSVAAAKSRVSRGRALLRERLLQCCSIERSHSGVLQDFQRQAEAGCNC